MGSSLSAPQRHFAEELYTLVTREGHLVSKNHITELVEAIDSVCPWVPEQGTFSLQDWVKIGTCLQGHPKIALDVLYAWGKVRAALKGLTPANILFAQKEPPVPLPFILPPSSAPPYPPLLAPPYEATDQHHPPYREDAPQPQPIVAQVVDYKSPIASVIQQCPELCNTPLMAFPVIRGYQVHYVRMENGEANGLPQIKDVMLADAQEMVISGLQPETAYSITVAAYTMKGDGARSKPRLVVTKGAVPGKPILSVHPTQGNTLLVKWEPPLDTEGQVLGYRLQFGRKDVPPPATLEFSPQEDQYVATNIHQGATYVFRLSVKSRAGFGEEAFHELTTPEAAPKGYPQKPYIAARFHLLPSAFALGDQKRHDGFENRALESGQKYVFFVLAVLRGSEVAFAASPFSDPIQLDNSDPQPKIEGEEGLIWVIGPVLAVVFIICIVTAILLYKNKPDSKRKDSKPRNQMARQ